MKPKKPSRRAIVGRAQGNRDPALSKFSLLARREARAALRALIEVMSDRNASPSARIAAAGALLTWGFGAGNSGTPDDAPTELAIRWLRAEEGDRRATRSRSKS